MTVNNFFDILQDILLKKSGGNLHEDTNFNKHMSVFMLCSYLSMRDELLLYSMMFNKYWKVFDNKRAYTWAYNNIPKQKNAYIKYISKKKVAEKE